MINNTASAISVVSVWNKLLEISSRCEYSAFRKISNRATFRKLKSAGSDDTFHIGWEVVELISSELYETD